MCPPSIAGKEELTYNIMETVIYLFFVYRISLTHDAKKVGRTPSLIQDLCHFLVHLGLTQGAALRHIVWFDRSPIERNRNAGQSPLISSWDAFTSSSDKLPPTHAEGSGCTPDLHRAGFAPMGVDSGALVCPDVIKKYLKCGTADNRSIDYSTHI